MPLTRASCQTRGSLETFYGELASSDDSTTADIGRAMVDILPDLHEMSRTRDVWGLTSHYHLWLLAADDYKSRWLVEIIGYSGEYVIGFRLPEADEPWANAVVHGTARTKTDALEMIETAMVRSGGWLRGEPPSN